MKRGQQASIFNKSEKDSVVRLWYLDESKWDIQKVMFLPILIYNIDDGTVRRWTGANRWLTRYKYYQ